MRKSLVLVGLLLITAGAVVAQDNFPKVETSPAFMYIRTPIGGESFNCAGGGGTIAYNVTSLIGLAADMGGCHIFGNTLGLANTVSGNQFTFLFGPRFTFRSSSRLQPFFEANFGGDHLSISCENAAVCGNASRGFTAFALTAGGGFDVKLNQKLALRLIQAEYMYTRFGNDCPLTVCQQNNSQNSFRMKSGLVIGWGLPPATPPSASCSVSPTDVYAGEPVTATANGMNFNPKYTLSYSWSGEKLSGKGSSASIDTTGMSPGSHTVDAAISDGKKGQASCRASFTIKERPKNPPQISCSANPRSVMAGTPSTISCNCSSPDNSSDYPVSVSISNWSASGGRISGSGSGATLDTTGASPGPISATATCTDSRRLTATGTASVNVEVPPAAPMASKLNEIAFKHNSARVDNTAKAILDDAALRLQRDADAHAVIVGFADPKELKPEKLAAERAANAKAYLTKEKGIDPSRIEIRTSSGEGMKADIWIVPAGASFNEPGTTVVTAEPTKAPYGHHAARKKATQ